LISAIFHLDFTNRLFGFPGFSKETGKFKLKNSEIQTIMKENPNKKTVVLFFGFHRFYVWVSRILAWISLFLYLNFANQLFFVWFSPIFCLVFPDFYLDFPFAHIALT
jgi:hypothetical protein